MIHHKFQITSMFQRLCIGMALFGPSAVANAQYSLSWHTIDAGGAMNTSGGAFELSGTIGQPDASSFNAPLSAGIFELVGGFWPVASGCACPGDLDGDCVVNISDLTALLAAFGCCPPNACYSPAADIDGSGCVDISDLSILLSRFGTAC